MVTADGILPELQREIDAFMATHGAALAASAGDASGRVDIAKIPLLAAPLGRLQSMASAISNKRFCETLQFLLSWLAALEGAGGSSVATRSCASWLVAFLVGDVLSEMLAKQATTPAAPGTSKTTTRISVASAEKIIDQILDRCIVVFQETFQSDAARAMESSGGFFVFKPATSQLRAPTAENLLQDAVAGAWRHVLSAVALCSLNPLRLRLQRQLLQALLATRNADSATAKDYLLLKNLSDIRLGLDITTFLWPTSFQQKVKDAALMLKMLQPLAMKPHKSQTRLAAVTAIASMLSRELDTLSASQLQQVYASVHAVAEWNSVISDLHSIALKLCGKREYVLAAWELRVGLLSLSPTEIFGRYWKEDLHALLRVQYQQNKDGGGAGPQAVAVLECVKRCFAHMLKRHFLTDRRVPGELDCMEIINTTQAWCFFAYPKQRSFQKLKDHVLPVLVSISVGIASYNMLYTVQSHLRRLLLEAEHIFDEKRLVGLEALLAVFDLCAGERGDSARSDLSVPLDRKVLFANRVTLGELVGQTLIEANALFGGELLIESTTAQAAGSAVGAITAHLAVSSATKLPRDEYRRALAIHSYACALTSLKHLYSALALSDDQKILIMVRSCIHNELVIRESASRALHHIIQRETRQASGIFRGVTDYIFRLSNHLTTPRDFDAFFVLIELLTSLLRSITVDATSVDDTLIVPWESRKAKQESLLQVEAVAVYMLVFEDPRLLQATLRALESVSEARAVAFDGDVELQIAATVERPSVIDVLRKAEGELSELLFSFESASIIASLEARDLGFFRQLITDLSSNARASFRWSSGLSVIFAQLAVWNPEVAAFMWSDVNDKVTKLEPAMPSLLDFMDFSTNSGFELGRWRNLAILATATACPYLLFQQPQNPEEVDATEQDAEIDKDGSIQCVISSSAVQALFRRLCRYLKSPSIDQKKVAILALGSAHVSSLPILTEVLQKYENEAFAPLEQPSNNGRHASLGDIQPPPAVAVNGSGPRKATKEQKARNVKTTAQLQLQWALGRCYCLLLHSTQRRPLVLDESTREAVHRLHIVAGGVLDKIASTLTLLAAPSSGTTLREVPQHVLFMMQQDFCSSVRALAALLSNLKSPYSSIRKRYTNAQDRDSSISSKKSTKRSTVAAHLPVSKRHRTEATTEEEDAMFDLKKREAWYHFLLGWCHSFSSLANSRLVANLSGVFFAEGSPARDHWMQRCDVLGDRFEETLLPWQWMDESDASRALGIEEAAMASFQRFFLCQTAFATLSVITQGPLFLQKPITLDSPVFRWLDECFSVETGYDNHADYTSKSDSNTHHFQSLQWFCHRILRGLLKSDFRAFVEVCADKSFFSVSAGDKHNVSKHYFRAICGVASDLKHEISKTPTTKDVATTSQKRATSSLNLEVRISHAILQHLGIENDAAQRERAACLINDLYFDDAREEEADSFQLNASVSSGKRSSAAFSAQVMNRMQVTGATYLVGKLTSLSLQMSMSILKFLSCCELVQQRKMLVVVLPWLAEVNLVSNVESYDSLVEQANGLPTNALAASVFESDQLLSLLFRITTNLSASCNDQLEQAWLTLAFANATTAPDSVESNLSRVLQFLFLQRTTSVRLSTAKMVVWWLCRWQSAAHEVLREALLLVETRRRQSAEASAGIQQNELVATPMIQPVDDVFVFVILMSDSCCHLATIPHYLYQNSAIREAMMVQTVHFAFLALFALALDPKSFTAHRNGTSASGMASGMEDSQQQSLYVDASNDCIVLIRNLLSQLYAPVELLQPIVDDLDAWSRSWTISDIDGSQGDRSSKSHEGKRSKATGQFERAMGSFASCLPTVMRNAWALECVKEITLALVPGSTLLSQTSSRCNNIQVLYCVRFGLLGYRVLSPEFHGDVFLSLLDLLHHALDEHARDPVCASAVICDTLEALKSMISSMPTQKLTLYPQILWVCVALLNHAKREPVAYHSSIVKLLVEILRVPHFATNELLQDVLLSKKPQQWNDDQASVLRTLVWTLDRGSTKTKQLTVGIVTQFLLLQNPVFHADPLEHLVICTMLLIPSILAQTLEPSNSQALVNSSENQDQDDAGGGDAVVSLQLDPTLQATELQFAWLAVGSTGLGEAFAVILTALFTSIESTACGDNVSSTRVLTDQFAQALIAEIFEVSGENAAFNVTMCFEILVKILTIEDSKKTLQQLQHQRDFDRDNEIVTVTLWLVESLMNELGVRKAAWRPTSTLLGSLARLVRIPEQTQTWQAAVRIMTCLGASNRSTSAIAMAALHQSPSSSPMKPRPQLTVSVGRETDGLPLAGDSPMNKRSSARESSGAGTPGKKDSTTSSARKFMNLMTGHRTGSPSASNPPSNQTTPPGRTSSHDTIGVRKQSSWAQDPAEQRSASPLANRRDL